VELKVLEPNTELATDPVCGMKVQPTTSHRAVGPDGKEVLFCCAGCRERFLRDPARYLKESNTAPPETAPAPAGTKYTCPMHPQIIRDRPGSCPICGMALEPVLSLGAEVERESGCASCHAVSGLLRR
jgi:Cu+-exporting ATPase